ncbi:hypothetical protein DV738_g5231, partial [Chaetothyriales sp. CBS 135597]
MKRRAAQGQSIIQSHITLMRFPNRGATDSLASAISFDGRLSATTFSSTFPQGNSFLDVSLIPPYGITPNISLNDGTPRCAGVEGKAIPCDCPPDPALFVTSLTSLVNSGQEFPEGNSASDQLTRLQACIVTLQNIYGGPGSGVGCPAVSTTWVALQKELQSQLR